MEHAIDPCYLDIVRRSGMTEHISETDALATIKLMNESDVEKSVNSLLPLVREVVSFSDRLAIYRLGAQVCIDAAET